MLTVDAKEAKPISIRQGAMIADRCILLPGSEVKRNAILGSGTFVPKGFKAPAGSIWLGNDECNNPKVYSTSLSLSVYHLFIYILFFPSISISFSQLTMTCPKFYTHLVLI